MSDNTMGIFLVGVFLLVLAVIFEAPVASGGGAVVMMVGLIYSFVVAKREAQRSREFDIDLKRIDFDD